MNKLDLTGRVAVVTGGARGIGLAATRRALDSGASVAIWDLDATQAEAVRAELGGKVTVHALDLTDEAAVAAATAATVAAHGKIDILVNNAGITGGNAPTWELPAKEWRRVIEVNLTGAFLVSQACIPPLRARGWGRIVMITSQAARTRSQIAAAHYAASKTGLMGFARSLATELGPYGITVNSIAPGRIDTPMASGAAPGVNEAFLRSNPVPRIGTARDVGEVVAFLATDAASYLTGTTIDVGGGSFMP